MKRWIIGLVVAASVSGLAFAQESTPEAGTYPDEIVVARPGFSPEGIEWDAQNGVFLLGSLADGTVYRVTDDGESTPFIEDEEIMVSVGIEVDEERRRLLVASSDPEIFVFQTATGANGLGAYDLDTGEKLFYVNLTDLHAGRNFANDVAVDADGNAYVTDSFSPVIYKVDVDGNASIFIEDERFRAPSFGLNGIAVHPDGYLIASVSGRGMLYKIPLDDPASMSEIALEQRLGADGIVFDADGNLIAVSGGVVYRLSSDDDFASAQIVGFDRHSPATTAALRDDQIYVIYAYLSNNTRRQTYEIVRVDFES